MIADPDLSSSRGLAPCSLSPCIGVCQLDGKRGLCRGCFRTIEEIARWSAMSRSERVTVANALAARRHAIGCAD